MKLLRYDITGLSGYDITGLYKGIPCVVVFPLQRLTSSLKSQ
jgi:hypothetical protein